jgi:hypothetical protein
VANRHPNTSGLKPFKKGQSGNPAGYSRGRRQVDALMQLIEEENAQPDILRVWLQAIRERDFRYFKEFLDRIDGKVADLIPDDDDGTTTPPRLEVPRKDARGRKRANRRKAPKGD